MSDEYNAPVTLRRITFRNPDGVRSPSTSAAIFSAQQISFETKPILGEHIVDCDADPYVPPKLSLTGEGTEHRRGGKLILMRDNVRLFLAEGQKWGSLQGDQIRSELTNKPVNNANLLDYYLAHQELIPMEWKGKWVCFWGTIYRERQYGKLCVRCLVWERESNSWISSHLWIHNVWQNWNPAALLAS